MIVDIQLSWGKGEIMSKHYIPWPLALALPFGPWSLALAPGPWPLAPWPLAGCQLPAANCQLARDGGIFVTREPYCQLPAAYRLPAARC